MVSEESEADETAAEAALRQKVERLEAELEACVGQLRTVEASATEAVAAHPAFLKMRASVIRKLQSLHASLGEARATYDEAREARAAAEEEAAGEGEGEEEEMDLSPMLRSALDKIWLQRPYDCRIFTLQLLQSLAQLDDRSLCMMSSCFARYIGAHSVDVEDGAQEEQ